MGFWSEVKIKIQNAIEVVQKDPILDAFATSALENIPVIGNLLVKIYNNSKDSPENKTEQILILLQKMENMHDNELENFCRQLEQNKVIILENQSYLKEISADTSLIINKLDEAKKERKIIVSDIQKIGNNFEKLLEEFEKLKIQVQTNPDEQNIIKKPNTFSGPDFRISWPIGWELVDRNEVLQSTKNLDPSMVQTLDLETISKEALVLQKKSDGKNRPNINLITDEPITDIKNYLDSIVNAYESLRGKIVKVNYDNTIGIGTLEVRLDPFGVPSFTIQKFYFRKNFTLLLTITQLTQDQLDEDPNYATEVTEILQSLVFLK